MTKNEMALILDKARVFFPAYFEKKTDETLLEIAKAWAELFAGVETRTFAKAFQEAILTSKFFPMPAEICEQLNAMTKRDELTEQEAWGLVREAMKTGRSDNKTAWESLPEAVKRAVGSSANLRDWSLMDANTVGTVIASNFMRSYRAIVGKQAIALLPELAQSSDPKGFALPAVERSSENYRRLEELGAHGLIKFQRMYATGLRGKQIPDEVRRAADEDLYRLEFAEIEATA